MKNTFGQKGFTLMESIAAIVLAGIVAVAVAPNLGSASKALNVDGAAKQVEADIRYAQNLANTTGDTYGFTATGNVAYTVYKKVGAVLTTVTSPYNHQPMNMDLTINYPGVTFTAVGYPTYTIEFDASGKPVTGGGTVVGLTAGADANKSVTVTSETGNVNIQ